MEIRRLGTSGLALSSVTLGTLTWGRDTDEHEADALLATYLEAGGRSIDVPSDYFSPSFSGRCALVGQTLSRQVERDEITLVVHSGSPTVPHASVSGRPTPPGAATSRRNLLRSLDHALSELVTPFVDVWVIRGPRRLVRYEEILAAAKLAVQSGRATYVAFADFSLWDLGALTLGAQDDRIPLAALAGNLSLLSGSILETQIPHAIEQGIGYIALAPLAHGVLTGKYRSATPPDSRAATTHLGEMVQPHLTPEADRVVEAVSRAAAQLDATPARVALAWSLAQPGVATAVTGPRTARQLETLLEGPTLKLQKELRSVLTEIALP